MRSDIVIYIKNNAGKKSVEEMSAEINRSKGTLSCYASQLGISLKTFRPMNLVDYVRENAGKKSVREMAEEKGCSTASIYSAASKGGVSTLMGDKESRLKNMIMEQGENLTAKEIAAMVETSVSTVCGKARKLGVCLKNGATTNQEIIETDVCVEETGFFNCGKYTNWLV